MDGRILFLVCLDARPTEVVENFATIGGASVNVWVRAASGSEAMAIARREIESAAWIPESQPSVVVVTRSDYNHNKVGREYFDQAVLDGIVLVFHTWPIDSCKMY